MKTIRKNVFETNSSSCHSVTLIGKDDYEKLLKNEKYPYDVNFYYEEHETTLIKLSSDTLKTVEEIYEDLTKVLNENGCKKDWLEEDFKYVKSNWSLEYLKKCLIDYDYDSEFWNYFDSVSRNKVKILYELRNIILDANKDTFENIYIFDGEIEC